MGIKPETEVQFLKGVGPKRAVQLSRLGITTVGDLLFHFPVRYDDRTNITPIEKIVEGSTATVVGVIQSAREIKTRNRRRMFQLILRDETGLLSCLWYSRGDYYKTKYKTELRVIVTGRVTYSKYNHCFEMSHPDIDLLEEGEESTSGGIMPVYPLTEGINQKVMRKIVSSAIDNCAEPHETLPKPLLHRLGLPPRAEAVLQIHCPGDELNAEELNNFRSPAHRRMIFEEFFIIECAMALQRLKNTEKVRGVSFSVDKETAGKILTALPFELTEDQRHVLNEIAKDLAGDHPMNRLLQGDVGSGKTAVAVVSMMLAASKGYQSALMAPTEILAEQHYNTLVKMDNPFGLKAALLTSGMKGKEKEEVRQAIATGLVDLVIGTHALIQGSVEFKKLGVVVIDEQHRFGVRQRAELISKGPKPNTLIMTATPIPRTLSMTLYGDLDVSVIKHAPKGRGSVETKVVKPKELNSAHRLIHNEVKKGRQAYLIYPLVEESEKSDLKAATEMYEKYRKEIFPDLRMGLVHGRMKPDEKNSVMHSFMKREIDILVATTVVEVGIDQPNATVMMVEHSERFGLAQLHQLRGRVGRGADQSYCLLAIEYPVSDIARERLKVMTGSTDGFYIAEKDLELRGTGDLFGTKQSGLPTFRIANLLRDFDLLKLAKDEAFKLIHEDPELKKLDNINLLEELRKSWKDKFQLADIG